MFRVQGKIDVDRPAPVVAAFLAAHENDAEWQKGVVGVRLVSGQAAAVGAKFERTQRIMGRELKSTSELVEVQDGRRVAYRTTAKILEYRTEYDLAPLGPDRTMVQMRIEGELMGFAAMFEGMAGEQLEKDVPEGLTKLKSVLEAR